MIVFLRMCTALTLLIGLLVGFAYSQPNWAKRLGMDIWEIPKLQRELAKQKNRCQDLDILNDKARRFRAVAKQTMDALIEDELSLDAAISNIAAVWSDSDRDAAFFVLRLTHKPRREQYGRLFIYWTGLVLREQPEKMAAVTRRIEDQLNNTGLQQGESQTSVHNSN